MPGVCRFILLPENTILEYRVKPGDTYEKALLSMNINPDTVLIISGKISIPQDAKIKEEMVRIISTCSRG
jgi:putative cell wall-binding protein